VTGEQTSELLTKLAVVAQDCFRLVNPHRLSVIPDKSTDDGDVNPVVPARLDGSPAVVRMAAVRLARNNASEVTEFIKEVKALLLVKHPCMVAVHGVCIERKAGLFAPVFELLEGAPLNSFMQKESCIKAATRFRLAMDVCSALYYLHDQKPPIAHGHLHGANILVESRLAGPRAKLLDCGWSALIKKPSCIDLVSPFDFGRRRTKTPWNSLRRRQAQHRKLLVWTAPEAFSMEEAAFTPSADVFSFGRLMYLVVTGDEPLHSVGLKAIEKATQKRTVLPLAWPDYWEAERLVMASLVLRCRSLVERCCIPNPLLRPSMNGAFNDVRYWLPEASLHEPSNRSFESESWIQPMLTSLSEASGVMREAPLCPQGHGALSSWATVRAQESSSCNLCDRRLALGCEAWWRCDQCHLDMCAMCANRVKHLDAPSLDAFIVNV
jgi:serine/threonine protein kinase